MGANVFYTYGEGSSICEAFDDACCKARAKLRAEGMGAEDADLGWGTVATKSKPEIIKGKDGHDFRPLTKKGAFVVAHKYMDEHYQSAYEREAWAIPVGWHSGNYEQIDGYVFFGWAIN